ITVEITDGGLGDSDGTENGVIIDPGGLGESGTTPSISGVGSSDGGCFITTTQTRTTGCLAPQVSLSPIEFFRKVATHVIEARNVLVHTFGVIGTLFGLLFTGLIMICILWMNNKEFASLDTRS
ncbi:MAG: hypothetical protein JRD47_04585, partial [Deltaproteobacteria bacterium]|nr:hypothetical protein [Deltaproteobacteria bacterium]